MAWRRKQAKGAGAEIVAHDDGILVFGSSSEVDVIVGELTARTQASGGLVRATSVGADVLAVAGSAMASGASHGTYLKLSKRAVGLLTDFGPEDSKAGTMWGFVRDKATGRITGILDGNLTDMNPMQLVSVQQALTTVALRAAIHEVAEGVARVEAHVEKIQRMLESQRVGDALGAYRVLRGLTGQLEAAGSVAATDWHAIAEVGVRTVQAIEMLRVNIREELGSKEGGWSTRMRADDLKDLADDDLRAMLALLLVHEHNLLAWHQLRVARMRSAEPEQLPFAIEQARQQLREQQDGDEAMLAELIRTLEQFVSPTGYEGLAPLSRRKLTKAGEELTEMICWFADQRTIDVTLPELLLRPRAVRARRWAPVLRCGGAVWRRQLEWSDPGQCRAHARRHLGLSRSRSAGAAARAASRRSFAGQRTSRSSR